MGSRAPRRDYLYVSTREVERLTTAPLELPAETEPSLDLLAEVVAEVEHTLRDQVSVRQVTDAELRVGDWFESSSLPMAYGVQAARRSTDSDAAVFVGQYDEPPAGAGSSVLLSGPSQHFRAGRPPPADISGGMSYPSAIFTLLASLSDGEVSDARAASDVALAGGDRRAPAHRGAPQDEHAREEQWLAVGYPMAEARTFFGRRGLFPLAFLARAASVVEFDSHGIPGRWILGVPLWVALSEVR
jgi:uncharacterized protein DUF7019